MPLEEPVRNKVDLRGVSVFLVFDAEYAWPRVRGVVLQPRLVGVIRNAQWEAASFNNKAIAGTIVKLVNPLLAATWTRAGKFATTAVFEEKLTPEPVAANFGLPNDGMHIGRRLKKLFNKVVWPIAALRKVPHGFVGMSDDFDKAVWAPSDMDALVY